MGLSENGISQNPMVYHYHHHHRHHRHHHHHHLPIKWQFEGYSTSSATPKPI
jgi:hypothetical protein